MDRRGRGRSGDGPVYAIEREFEDVTAVLQATPTPACLLGHSDERSARARSRALDQADRAHGALRAAAGRAGPAAELSRRLCQRLAGLLALGDRAGVIETFLREVIQMAEGVSRACAGHRRGPFVSTRLPPCRAKCRWPPPTASLPRPSPACACRRCFCTATTVPAPAGQYLHGQRCHRGQPGAELARPRPRRHVHRPESLFSKECCPF